jgi:hypothetical protein
MSRITAAVALLLVAAAVLIRQPVLTSIAFPGATHADPATLRRHVEALAAHRSPDYTRHDTADTLDFGRMARVVDGVFSAAAHIAR